jgi:hypothetical protein
MGRGGPSQTSAREGVALPLLLLLLLALTLLAQGTLILAQRELKASTAFLHATRTDQVARSALLVGLQAQLPMESSEPSGRSVRLFREWLDDGLWRGASLRWLDREFFLLEGEGRSQGWAGGRKVAGVGWRMDPPSRMAALGGGVEVGGDLRTLDGGRVSGEGFLSLPEEWEEADCAPYAAELDSLFPSGAIRLVSYLPVEGSVAVSVGIPGLGLLEEAHLLARSGEGGDVGSGGDAGGTGLGCPGSGDPVFLGTEGPLTLNTGWSCGLLVVRGDLSLEGNGLFQGVALVGGDLQLAGGWTFQGVVRVRGSVVVRGPSTLDASGCAALRTFNEIAGLREPLLLPGGSFNASF